MRLSPRNINSKQSPSNKDTRTNWTSNLPWNKRLERMGTCHKRKSNSTSKTCSHTRDTIKLTIRWYLVLTTNRHSLRILETVTALRMDNTKSHQTVRKSCASRARRIKTSLLSMEQYISVQVLPISKLLGEVEAKLTLLFQVPIKGTTP